MKNLTDICNESLLSIPDNFDSYAGDTKYSVEMAKLASEYVDLNDFELDTKNLVLTPKGRNKTLILDIDNKLPIIYYTYRNRKFKSILDLMDRGFSFNADLKFELTNGTNNFKKYAEKLSCYNFVGGPHILYAETQKPDSFDKNDLTTISKFLDDTSSFQTLYIINELDCEISKYLNNLDIENIVFSFEDNSNADCLRIQNMKCKNLWITYCSNIMDVWLDKSKDGYDENTAIKEVLTDYKKYLEKEKRTTMIYKFVSDILANLKFTIKHNPRCNIICSFYADCNPYILTLDSNDNLIFTKSNIKI